MSFPVESDKKTCYGTFLALNNYDEHLTIIGCLVDSDPNTLIRNLNLLSDEKLWYVDKDDIKKIQSPIIKIIFRKFDVRAEMFISPNNIPNFRPMEFNIWLRHIMENLHPIVSNIISKNNNLLNYLHQLIDLCRNNPNILNPQYSLTF